jgi:hypothetical protein
MFVQLSRFREDKQFWSKNVKRKDHLEDLEADGKILLK